jgi:EmrB/QacA subfamily drug resistance transporter
VTEVARAVPPVALPHALTRRERVAALTGVLLALLLAALDQTIVATAGPAIQRDLLIAPATYPWITTAYLVASTVMVPIYGKLSDLFGRKPVLLAGVSIFLAGSLLCGLSPNVGMLITARAVQGLGAAALFTSAFTVIADLFPAAERGKYAGLIGGVMGIASVVGPLVGGVLTDAFGWHWVFFVNLPIGAIAIWFISQRMPPLATGAVAAGGRRPRIDYAGAAMLVLGVVPLLLALTLGGAEGDAAGAQGWTRWPVLALLALAAMGVAGFVVVERRATDPILDFRLFRSRTVGLGTAAVFLLGAAFLAAVVFLPLFLVNVIGVSATRAGLTMMPLTFGVVTGSIGGGQIVARTGRYRVLMLLALAVMSAGFAVMAFTLSPATSQLEVTLRMVLVGLGIGPTFPIYTLLVQNASDPRDLGVVTAALTFSRSLGQVIGVAVLGSLFAVTLGDALAAHGSGPAAAAEAFTDATRRLYQIGMVLAIATLLLSIGIPELPLRRGHGPRATVPPPGD